MPPPPRQGSIWQCLKTFLLVTTWRGWWICCHLVGRGQGGRQTPLSAQDTTHSEDLSGSRCPQCRGRKTLLSGDTCSPSESENAGGPGNSVLRAAQITAALPAPFFSLQHLELCLSPKWSPREPRPLSERPRVPADLYEATDL